MGEWPFKPINTDETVIKKENVASNLDDDIFVKDIIKQTELGKTSLFPKCITDQNTLESDKDDTVDQINEDKIAKANDEQGSASNDKLNAFELDKEETEENEKSRNENASSNIVEQSNHETTNEETTDFMVTVLNEIVDAVYSDKALIEHLVKSEEVENLESKSNINNDNKCETMEEQKPVRQRIPSSASSDGRISRKISYEDETMADPIEVALNDLRLSVSEFCDICLQELHGL